MLRGNRLLATALVIVAALTVVIGIVTWPSMPTLTDYGVADPRNADYTVTSSECQPSNLESITDRRKRSGKADACAKEAEEYRQNTADLIQQTRSADAAEAQADISSQQLWFGWLQALGGFLTLAAAVGAAIYAREAAKHTELSNNIAREQLMDARAQNYPFVRVKTIDVSVLNDGRLEFHFRVENFGETPAIDVVVVPYHQYTFAPEGDFEELRRIRHMADKQWKEVTITEADWGHSLNLEKHSERTVTRHYPMPEGTMTNGVYTQGVVFYRNVWGEIKGSAFFARIGAAESGVLRMTMPQGQVPLFRHINEGKGGYQQK